MGLMPEDERLRDQPDENYKNVTKRTDTNELHISIPLVNYQGLRDFRQKHTKELQDLVKYKLWAELQLDADREAFSNLMNKNGLRKVVIEYKIDGEVGKQAVVSNRGWFQAWSTGPVPLATQTLQVPVALIEHENGTVAPYTLDQFKFEEWPDEWEEDEEK